MALRLQDAFRVSVEFSCTLQLSTYTDFKSHPLGEMGWMLLYLLYSASNLVYFLLLI